MFFIVNFVSKLSKIIFQHISEMEVYTAAIGIHDLNAFDFILLDFDKEIIISKKLHAFFFHMKHHFHKFMFYNNRKQINNCTSKYNLLLHLIRMKKKLLGTCFHSTCFH